MGERPERSVLLVPVLVALAGAWAIYITGPLVVQGTPWIRWVPNAVVLTVAEYGSDFVTREVTRRVEVGRVDDRDDLADVVEQILVRQADRTKSWSGVGGDLIEAVRDAGLLTDEAWQQYLREANPLTVTYRKTVLAGSTLPVEFAWSSALTRGGTSVKVISLARHRREPPEYLHRTKMVAARIGDGPWQQLDPPIAEETPGDFNGGGHVGHGPISFVFNDHPIPIPADTQPGPIQITVRLDAGSIKLPQRQLEFTTQFEEVIDVMVLPANTTNDITLISNPAAAEAMRESLRGEDWSFTSGDLPMLRGIDDLIRGSDFSLNIKTPPYAIASTFELLAGDEVILAGNVFCFGPASGAQLWQGLSDHQLEVVASSSGPFRLVLRPSRDVARRTINLTAIWGETIEVELLGPGESTDEPADQTPGDVPSKDGAAGMRLP
ncbi:MAG: hypothetical protein AAGK78_03170 [Planctomycetota bacterium]